MGLDMYLYKTAKVDGVDYEDLYDKAHAYTGGLPSDVPEEFRPYVRKAYPEFLPKYNTVFHEVMYWRKFNALHAHMVDTYQDGVDECQLSKPLTKQDLQDIIDVVKEDKIEPREGFFFGSYTKDEWYKQDCKWTVEEFRKIINNAGDNEVFFYRSSW